MVHGLWGDMSAYQSFESYLDGSGYYPSELTFRVDYSASNAVPLYDNRFVIPTNINSALSIARAHSYSTGKVDIIAHSMGGLLSRYYLQSSAYQQKQDIHKLITLNTPHSGSQWCKLLTSLTTEGDAARIVGEFVAQHAFTYPSTIYGGAINDMAVNSYAMGYLNSSTLNNGIVPSHAMVSSCPVGNDNIWYEVAGTVAPLEIMTINSFVNYIFDGDQNDMAVSIPSQTGGLPYSAVSPFTNQWHLGPYDNPLIRAELTNALNTNSANSSYFTPNGFSPLSIGTNFKTDQNEGSTLQLQPGSVTITSPSQMQSFNAGDIVHVNISSLNGVNRLLQIGTTRNQISAVVDTFISNGTLDYQIPSDAIGTANIIVFGYDPWNMMDYDTVTVKIAQPASIDSVSIYGDTLYIGETSTASVSVLAHYNNGHDYIVSGEPSIQYQISDTNIAKPYSANLFIGKHVGVTTLFSKNPFTNNNPIPAPLSFFLVSERVFICGVKSFAVLISRAPALLLSR